MLTHIIIYITLAISLVSLTLSVLTAKSTSNNHKILMFNLKHLEVLARIQGFVLDCLNGDTPSEKELEAVNRDLNEIHMGV